MSHVNENWQCRGVNYPRFEGARGVAFMDNTPYDWIILAINAGCLLYILFGLNMISALESGHLYVLPPLCPIYVHILAYLLLC